MLVDEATRKELVAIRGDIRQVAERVASIEAKVDSLHSPPCPYLTQFMDEKSSMKGPYFRLLNGLLIAVIGGLVSLVVAAFSGVFSWLGK